MMEPRQNVVMPEVTPTAEASEAPVGIESTPIAEVAPQSPVQSFTEPTTESIVTEPGTIVPAQDDSVIAPEEVRDLVDSGIEAVDKDWIGKVRDIIRDDQGHPFKEEQDAEELNERYMQERFKVDVDAPIEEK